MIWYGVFRGQFWGEWLPKNIKNWKFLMFFVKHLFSPKPATPGLQRGSRLYKTWKTEFVARRRVEKLKDKVMKLKVFVVLCREKKLIHHMGGLPKIGGFFTPNHPFVHRGFHYFHHPFWGKTPLFLETPIWVLLVVLNLVLEVTALGRPQMSG